MLNFNTGSLANQIVSDQKTITNKQTRNVKVLIGQNILKIIIHSFGVGSWIQGTRQKVDFFNLHESSVEMVKHKRNPS